MATILFQLGLLYFLGHLFEFSFQRFRIPDILLFTILGIILGPILGVARVENFGNVGNVLSTLALVVILFESGATLDFKKAAEASGISILLTVVTMALTIGVIFALTIPFTGSVITSLLIGVIAGGTSSAVVIPMVGALGISERLKNALILESAFTDVLAILLTLGITQSIISGGFGVSSFVSKVAYSFFIAILIGGVVGLGWSLIRRKFDAQFATIAAAMIVYSITELGGFSGPIAVMSMGIFMAQAPRILQNVNVVPLSDLESGFYRELVFIFKVFFFIYLGISIQVKGFAPAAVAVGAMLIIFAARFFLVRVSAARFGNSKDLAYTSLLVPKGLAAAVLAGVPMQNGIAQADFIQNQVYTIVIVSIILVSVLIPLMNIAPVSERLAGFFKTSDEKR